MLSPIACKYTANATASLFATLAGPVWARSAEALFHLASQSSADTTSTLRQGLYFNDGAGWRKFREIRLSAVDVGLQLGAGLSC
jgi:hypothetical protein